MNRTLKKLVVLVLALIMTIGAAQLPALAGDDVAIGTGGGEVTYYTPMDEDNAGENISQGGTDEVPAESLQDPTPAPDEEEGESDPHALAASLSVSFVVPTGWSESFVVALWESDPWLFDVNGEMDMDEVAAQTGIFLPNRAISSLAGIENFTALLYLDVRQNLLTELDVSNNTELEQLFVAGNQLTTLDLSNNTELKSLSARNTRLTALDISNNTALTDLDVGGTRLTTLNLSNNTALEGLFVHNTPLTMLDLSNNSALIILYITYTQLETLDVSGSSELRILIVMGNLLTTLDVSANTRLTLLDVRHNRMNSPADVIGWEGIPDLLFHFHPQRPRPAQPPTGGSDRDRDSGGSGLLSGVIPLFTPTERLLTATDVATLHRNEDGSVRTRHNGRFSVQASAWASFGFAYQHDSMVGQSVDVRLHIDDPRAMTVDVYVSAWTGSQNATWIRNHFERFFDNQIRVVEFDHAGAWGQTVRVAARLDLAGMDTDNLVLYTYDREVNRYRRILEPNYRIDRNGYLHFRTDMGGAVIVSDGALVRR